jgi:hypothetical protein
MKTLAQRTKGMIKVRVYFKNPIGRKSATAWVTESHLQWEREHLGTGSPYKKIVRIK